MYGGGEGLVSLEQLPQRDEEQDAEESSAAYASSDAGLSHEFQVVVVGVVDDLAVVVGLVGGKDGLQGAQTGAGPRMVEEDVPGVEAHGGTLAVGHLQGLQRGKAVKDLFYAQPRDQKE